MSEPDLAVTGPIGPGAPLVVLLHGLGGSALDMTNPGASKWGAVMRDRTAAVAGPANLGIHLYPEVGVDHYEIDPPVTPLRSWRQALNEAGFPTLSYTQTGGSLAADVGQLILSRSRIGFGC